MIPIFLDEALVRIGDNSYIEWNPASAPHVLLYGSTGSGKTYAAKLLLAKVALYEKDSQIYVLDYKGDTDFDFLHSCERFFRYDECSRGMEMFFNRFKARQDGTDKSRHLILLFFDELASYINSFDDKKQMEAEKKKISSLLMLSRSLNIQIVCSLQRCDSIFFSSGARDNFNLCIALGFLSDEGKSMMFGDYKKSMKPKTRGKGYMLMNGAIFKEVQVPTITDFDKLHATIKDGVTR